MTNSKNTKRALTYSVLALFLCVAMLIGTTFAWFTDTASTGVNKIQAGNLDIEVSFAKEAKNDDGTLKGELTEFKTIENATEVFDNNALWEPGRIEYIVFKIENKGNLALKYRFSPSVIAQKAGTNVYNQEYKLADYLCASAKADNGPGIVNSGYVDMGDPGFSAFMTKANDLGMTGYDKAATPAEKPLNGAVAEGTLEAGKINCVCMAVWMPETVGNEANAIDSERAASIDLGINVVATQAPYESDSFGNGYDASAEYSDASIPTTATVYTADELKNALHNFTDAGSGNKTISIADNIVLKEGETWTPVSVDGYRGAGIITVEGNGHTISGLNDTLFAGGFAGESGIVIKNLTLDNVRIDDSTSSLGIGAFIGSVDSMPKIELIDCHLINSVITSTGGARVGGLIGWTSGYNNPNDGPVDTHVTITGCSVENCSITAKGSVGGIIGHAGSNAATYQTITDCKVEQTHLKSTDDGGWRVGVVVGTANVGQLTIKGITNSGNTVTQTGKTAPDHSDLYGRFVPGSTGKLIIDGKNIQ